MDKDTYQERSRKTLQKFMDQRKDKMLNKILTIVEVLVPNKLQWEKTRKHILSICNDYHRDVVFELEKSYKIEYVSNTEDIIQVQTPKVIRRGE